MTDQHPITPPPELVQQWFLGARAMPVDQWVTDVATQAARWGADQELEACCEVLRQKGVPAWSLLRLHRRPKPKIDEEDNDKNSLEIIKEFDK